MRNRFILFVISLISMIISFNISVNAFDVYEISGLNSCDQILFDCYGDDVYAYGVTEDSVCVYNCNSNEFYSCSIDGGIVSSSVAHNGKFYFLYEDFAYNKNLLEFNASNCESKTIPVVNSDENTYFQVAVTENSYFLVTLSVFSYVTEYDFDGQLINEYKFDNQNVNSLFMNNSETYAVLADGEVYKLSDGAFEYCTTVSPCALLSNAGERYITDESNIIYSLKENLIYENFTTVSGTLFVSNENVFCSSETCVYVSDLSGVVKSSYNHNNKINTLFVHKNKAYIFSDDYSVMTVVSLDEFSLNNSDNSNNQNVDNNKSESDILYKTDNDIFYDIPVASEISDLKKQFDCAVKIYDKNGKEITSGILKTGYTAEIGDENYIISVKGDVTGTGTLNSRDVFLLMDMIIEEKQLFGAYKKAADFNLDGCVDNKDLLLISREMD